MVKVDFLICGRRGFDVLQYYAGKYGADAINKVATYADKNVANDPYDEVLSYCIKNNISSASRTAYTFEPNIFRLVIGWQWMLPDDNNTIVLHDSLLPKYRGFAPLVNSLIKGEHEIGVTAFVANDAFDEGPIIGQEKIAVDYPITIIKAMELITPLYCTLTDLVVKQLSGTHGVRALPQDHYLATYSLWRDEADYKIDWSCTADEIKRLIDATGFPYKGAVCFLNDEAITIRQAEIFGDVPIENRTVGKVIFIKNNCPVVVCSTGLLKITEASLLSNGSSILPFSKLRSRFH